MVRRSLACLAALDSPLQPPACVVVIEQFRPAFQDDLADHLGHEAGWPIAVLRRTRAIAASADRVGLAHFRRQPVLDADLVAPGNVQVILVGEPGVLAEPQGGNDLINVLKQAAEFGLRGKMRLAALVTFLGDIHAAGLQTMQGLLFTNSFYWDLNDRTRAFTARVLPKLGGIYPGMTHAGCYGITMHYLRAVAAMGVPAAKASGAAAVAKMKAIPIDDDAFGTGHIRADGRAVIPAYLLQVKTPAESKKPWDYCTVVSTLAPEQTVRPLAQVGCPLIKA